MRASRVAQRNGLVYRRLWKTSVLFSFFQPVLFLTAMGIGVGALVNRNNPDAFGGITYLAFIAPGMMANTCMQTASFECTWPIMNKITWGRNYEAMLSTPLTVADLLIGELMWLTFRLFTIAAIFLGVIALFGIPQFPGALLALPLAVLTGLMFGAAILAYTAQLDNADGFNGLFRFVITPMFLFSGAFFPIERLPDALRPIVYVTPLYHGVAAVRGLTLGNKLPDPMTITEVWSHAMYLIVVFLISTAIAYRNLNKRMVK